MLFGAQSGKVHAVARRMGVFAGSVTLAFCLLGSSAAMAQNCNSANPFLQPIATGLSAGLAVSAAVSAANTAFLTQSSAFVSAPANPKPDSEGGGLWIRGDGGELTTNSNTQLNLSLTAPAVALSLNATCSAQFHQTFVGFQLGQDIAKLNVAGWNLHLGTTAGFLESRGNIVGGNILGGAFDSTTQAPFVGMYGAATFGNFFVDGLLRYNYFQT